MNYHQAKAAQQIAESEYDAACDAMKEYPTGLMGMTPDAVKGTAEFQLDRRNCAAALKNLQVINILLQRNFKKEEKEYWRAKKAARQAALATV